MEGVFKDHVKEIEFSKTPKISKHDTNDDNTVNEDTEAEKVRTMTIAIIVSLLVCTVATKLTQIPATHGAPTWQKVNTPQ